MTDKELITDKNLSAGCYFELAIQVCKSSEIEPVKKYFDLLWKLKDVKGPFDNGYNEIDKYSYIQNGILNIENYKIPFTTFNIREEIPIETGFIWFDLCFSESAIQKIFGEEYEITGTNSKNPEILINFLKNIMEKLYTEYPFELAIIGVEVSGQYYLQDLETEMENQTNLKFYVGKDKLEKIAESNKNLITVMKNK
jgi:hypothetical protein